MILSPRTLVVEIKDALKLWNNDLNHRQKDRIRERGCLGEEGGEQTRELRRKEASTHILSNFLFSLQFSSVQFRPVAQSCPTLCNPMNRSTPGLPVHHQLPEFTQTHVYRVGDAIQPSHPLSSPFPPAPNPSQRQSLFQ